MHFWSFISCWHIYCISSSPGPCSENIWWLLMWPWSRTSLFLFRYFLVMTKSTRPSEQDQPYLTLSSASQAHKTVPHFPSLCFHPTQLWQVLNMIWLCITSLFAITPVTSDQNTESSRIRGKWIQQFWYLLICKIIFWGSNKMSGDKCKQLLHWK